MQSNCRWLVALAACAGLPACGSRLHPVDGQLVWADGRPAVELAGGWVYFESAAHRTISRAQVRSDGRFTLTTNRPGGDDVPDGTHRVYVVEPRPSEEGKSVPPNMDSRFANPDTSGLEVTVPPPSVPVVLQLERARRMR
jgi:hypothetical protein